MILWEEIELIVSKAEFYSPAAHLNRTTILNDTSFLKDFFVFFQSTVLTTTKKVEKAKK